MKKYFMKGTDDELQFGDMIELDFVGEEDGVKKHTHLEVKFLPEYVDELLEEEVIEEREMEDGDENDDLIDFNEDFEGFKEAVAEDVEEINDRLRELYKRLTKIEEKVSTLEELYRLLAPKKAGRPASSKKK